MPPRVARDNPLPPREVIGKSSGEQGSAPGEAAQAGDPPRVTVLHTHLQQGKRPGYGSPDRRRPGRAPALLPGRRASAAIGSRVAPRDLKGTRRRYKPLPSGVLAALPLPPLAPTLGRRTRWVWSFLRSRVAVPVGIRAAALRTRFGDSDVPCASQRRCLRSGFALTSRCPVGGKKTWKVARAQLQMARLKPIKNLLLVPLDRGSGTRRVQAPQIFCL